MTNKFNLEDYQIEALEEALTKLAEAIQSIKEFDAYVYQVDVPNPLEAKIRGIATDAGQAASIAYLDLAELKEEN
jgi:hypothetical protein